MSKNATAVIASGASQSNAIDLGASGKLLALEMPAAWTAAAITVLAASEADGTYVPVHDDGGVEVSLTVAASRIVGIDAEAGTLAALRFIKLRSGNTATPVNQAAERTIKVIVKE